MYVCIYHISNLLNHIEYILQFWFHIYIHICIYVCMYVCMYVCIMSLNEVRKSKWL